MSLRQAAQQALEAMESFQQSIGVFRGEFEEEVAALRAALDVTPAQMQNALRRKKGWRIMDRDTVIALAVKAGITPWKKKEWSKAGFVHTDDGMDGDVVCLLQFAALVAAHERKECANVCDEIDRRWINQADKCAAAIRSRT